MGKLTYLNARTGHGKSTIFDAIYWCLFGGLQDIYPDFEDRKKSDPTCVILDLDEYEGIIIKRTKPSERVEVSLKNNVLHGDPAQEYIESLFGSRLLWLSSSYLVQEERCELITATGENKFSILKEIAFDMTRNQNNNRDNPEYYVSKIEKELDKIKEQLTAENGSYNGLLRLYKRNEEKLKNDIRTWKNAGYTEEVDKSDLEYIGKEIEKIKNEIDAKQKLYNETLQIEKELQRKNELMRKYNDFDSKLKSINIENVLIDIEIANNKINECNEILKKATTLNTNLDEIDKNIQECGITEDFLKVYNPNLLFELHNMKSQYIIIKESGFDSSKLNEIKFELNGKLKEIKEYKLALEKYKELNYDEKYNEELKKIQEKNDQLKNQKEKDTLYNKSLDSKYEMELKNWQLQVDNIKNEYNNAVSINNMKIKQNTDLKQKYLKEEKEKKDRIVNENNKKRKEYESLKQQKLNEYKAIVEKNDLIEKNYNLELEKQQKELAKSEKEIKAYEDKYKNDSIQLENDRKNYEIYTKKYEELYERLKKQNCDYTNIDKTIFEYKTELNEQICPHCFNGIIIKNTIAQKGKLNLERKNELAKNVEELEKIRDEFKLLVEVKKPLLETIEYNPPQKYVPIEIPIPELIDETYEEIKDLNQYEEYVTGKEPEYLEIENIKEPEYPVKPKDTEKRINTNVKLEDIPKYNPPKPPVNKYDVEDLDSEMEKINTSLNKIEKYVIPKYSEKAIDNYILQSESISKYNMLIDKEIEINEILEKLNINEVKKNLDLNTKKYSESNQNKELHDEYCKNLEFLLGEIELIKYEVPIITSNQITKDIEILKNDLKNCEILKNAGYNLLSLNEQKENLDATYATIVQNSEKNDLLLAFKDIVNNEATVAMRDHLNSINNAVNFILREIFDEDIRILLDTHKMVKTTNNEKLQVNLQILHKGILYSKFGRLSGGEKDRISFAIALGLSQLKGNKIMLLDECFKGIGENEKVRCLELLKNHFSNMTIIEIGHASVKGQHDFIFDLEKEKENNDFSKNTKTTKVYNQPDTNDYKQVKSRFETDEDNKSTETKAVPVQSHTVLSQSVQSQPKRIIRPQRILAQPSDQSNNQLKQIDQITVTDQQPQRRSRFG